MKTGTVMFKIPMGATVNKEGMVYYEGLFLGIASKTSPGFMEVIGVVKVKEEEKEGYYNLVRLHPDDVAMQLHCQSLGSEHEITFEEAQEIVKDFDMDRIADRMSDALMNHWGDTLEIVVNEYIGCRR